MINPLQQSDKLPATKLVLLLLNPMIWMLPLEKRYEKLNAVLEEVSDYSIIAHYDAILWVIRKNFSKSECKKYRSAENQCKSLESKVPRLSFHRSMLLERIRKARRKAGLIK